MSVIYFVRAGEAGPIKIGFSARGDIATRISELQGACPWPLRLIGTVTGTKPVERHLHQLLAEYRMCGEWFAPERAVLRAIDQALAPEFSISPASVLDRAIMLAGSQTMLSFALGVGQPAISLARKRGMSADLRQRVEAFLEARE